MSLLAIFAPSWTIPKTYPCYPPASASSLRAGVNSQLSQQGCGAEPGKCSLLAVLSWESGWGGCAALSLAWSLGSCRLAAGGVCSGRSSYTTPSASLIFRRSLAAPQGMVQFEVFFWSAGEVDGLKKRWLVSLVQLVFSVVPILTMYMCYLYSLFSSLLLPPLCWSCLH